MTKNLIETILEIIEGYSDVLGKGKEDYNKLVKKHKESESRLRVARKTYSLEKSKETEHELVQSAIDHKNNSNELKNHPLHPK